MPIQPSLLEVDTSSADLSFSDRLLRWYRQHGRKHLPWQQNRTPYRVWISEIMLQQTQVNTVIPYYEKFMASFPTVADLAQAEEDNVLHHWTGLGYYARARNLHKCARIIHHEHKDIFPGTVDELSELPGIGRSTAGAILTLGAGKPAVILDGNVKRVLSRHNAIAGWPGQTKVEQQLWHIAEELTPHSNCANYTQAIMDLGATLCTRTRPACPICPVSASCIAYQKDRAEDFPGKKPKKILPEKATHMLIFHEAEGDRVLLEKRPPQGIWGGLWSFPESEDISHLNDLLLNQVMSETQTTRRWKPLRHTFSHFHLDITPVVITLDRAQVSIMENDHWHWYDLANPPKLGLAAPVKKLLTMLNEKGRQ